jgi:predicted dehydrogenase
MEKIAMKFGILGLGSIGSRHANNLLKMGHSIIGYDTARYTQQQWGALAVSGLDFVNDLQPLLDANPDGILICTPTGRHIDDIKLVPTSIPTFVEKPITTTVEHWPHFELLDNRIFVGYNLRFHPLVRVAREWLPLIKEPIWGSFSVGQENTKYKDHVALNWSHELDLALHLLGEASLEGSYAWQTGAADMILEHVDGAISTVHLDYLTKPWYRTSIIQGAEGRITIDFEAGSAWLEGHNFDNCHVTVEPGEAFDESYVKEMEQFVQFAKTGSWGFGCTASDAFRVVEIAEQVINESKTD